MRQVLIDNFDFEVVAAYDKFRPYSYKADLGRYCLLYAMGGWYFDIAIKLIMPITLHDDLETLAFKIPLEHHGRFLPRSCMQKREVRYFRPRSKQSSKTAKMSIME